MRYRIESTWVMSGVQIIEADNILEAEKLAENGPLPSQVSSEYLSESFEVTDSTVLCEVCEHDESTVGALSTTEKYSRVCDDCIEAE